MHQLRSCTRDESGAVAILFSLLLSGMVLLGAVALSVDFGNLSAAHSQLQSSADAAALKAAKQCATSTCPTAASLDAISQANDNSSNPSSVTTLCGNASDGSLAGCGAIFDNASLTLCGRSSSKPVPAHYVAAITKKSTHMTFTNNGAGSDNSGQACGAVAWGPVASYSAVLPITFSVCEWQNEVGGDPLTGNGTNYAPSPPYPPYPASNYEKLIKLESKTDGACTTFNGHDAPGGFGWLTSGSGCTSATTTDDWVQVDTGNNTPSGCQAQLQAALGKVIAVPVYDCMYSSDLGVGDLPSDPSTQCSTGNGTHLYYHIAGYAGFYLTGWQLSGSSQNSIVSGTNLCSSGEKCIQGYFVRAIVNGDVGSGGTGDPGFGVIAVQSIG